MNEITPYITALTNYGQYYFNIMSATSFTMSALMIYGITTGKIFEKGEKSELERKLQ